MFLNMKSTEEQNEVFLKCEYIFMGIIALGLDSYLTYRDFGDVAFVANLQFQTSSPRGEIVMTTDVAASIEATSSESLKVQRQVEVINKLKEDKLLAQLKKEKAELELEKIRTKFELIDPRFAEVITDKDGKSFRVPRFSHVERKEDGKSTLKVLLVERNKKAKWLGLDSTKDPNWMSLVKEKVITSEQVKLNDDNAKELLALLKKHSLMTPVS